MIASRIIGHRGAAALAPENTLAGIRMAAECGVRWVELDITLLGDETPVLCHDDELDRCTNQSGPLSFLSAIDLPKLDAGVWFDGSWANEPMPHLSDALLLCQELELGLNLEIKPHGIDANIIARKVFEEISVYWHQPEKLIISCYEQEVLSAYRSFDLFAQLGLLFDHLPDLWLLKAQALQAVSIHCDCQLIDQDEIKQVKQSGYDLYCYTCNDTALGKHLIESGVDGIFTDNPTLFNSDEFRGHLQSQSSGQPA
ncbi:glycerophosphoryl diester phosphodiesterase [Neptuniibacter sp.]|uniref:glycerophosphoryl diester phosphodiesterase n=1 Tax=Neptuniibacter sp. TaxID=1962643 RepID=UPI0026283FC4|nr:glycerophosphoryl diester phosphodiesterase [Neptuniibacter sp.]MCP4595520.1 glycerophosphoryl diester phosphodiesterase [Neptuniibacter sp.]